MEEVEARSESPSSKTIPSSRLSNLSNEEVFQESEPKELLTKKRSASLKRKSRNSDKENGEVNPGTNGTNGDVHVTEEKKVPQIGDTLDLNEANAVTSPDVKRDESENRQSDVNQENSEEAPKENESNGGAGEAVGDKSINGNAQIGAPTAANFEENMPNSEETSPKEVANDSMNVDTEESFFTAETESIPTDKAESVEMSPKDVKNVGDNVGNLDSESERDKENGFEGTADRDFKLQVKTTEQSEKAEPSKGFFGKWSFSLMSDKKEPETNGYSDDINTAHLYFSSIRGRMPLNRASPVVTVGGGSKDSVIFRKDAKTPPLTRTLDDSFGVKSEPSRLNRGESKEKPNLRKFPGKRCLNTDESDDKEESFLTSLPFTKRRKLEEDKTRTGFLRSFLWSPFRKRSVSDGEDASSGKLEDKTAVTEVKPSWFRSPFWFWKRCNKEERDS